MEAATATSDPVQEAKDAKKQVQEELKSARAELKKSKQGVTNAEKVASAEGLEGQAKKDADKAVKEAKSAQDAAAKRVLDAENAVSAANQSVKDAQEAEKKRKAEERANRPKKASLTLSQRRALLKLQGQGEVVAKTDFNTLPLDHLVNVGLAERFEKEIEDSYQETESREVEIPKDEREEGGPTTKTEKVKVDKTRTIKRPAYRLTDQGTARAGEINPKWLDWRPDRDGAGATTNGGGSTEDAPAESGATA